MGKHTSSSAGAATASRGSIAAIAIAGIAALIIAAFALSALASDDDPTLASEASATGTATETERPSMGGDPSTEDADASENNSDEGTPDLASPTVDEDSAVPVSLQKCQSEVAAGEEWAQAAAASASHWKQHYTASMKYNAGTITLEQAEAEFAASKAAGSGDVEAITATQNAYTTAMGACQDLGTDDMPSEYAEAAQSCAERSEALAALLPVGQKMNSDWAEHIEMMGSKDEADPEAYYERWRMMVEMAPDNMVPYEAAAAEFSAAPACPSV